MRKTFLMFLLATSVAMPAMAQDDGGRNRERGARTAEQREEARAQRAERRERPANAERAAPPERVERQRPQVADRANWSDRGAERQRAVEQQQLRQPTARQDSDRQAWGDRRRDDARTNEGRRERLAPVVVQNNQPVTEQRRDYRRDDRQRDGSYTRRTGDQRTDVRQGDRRSTYSGSTTQWNSRWRNDRNHDWRRYRDRNRSVFRLGYYNDPYGSRYRRFSIGFSLYPSYYRSNYWLNDPWMYRLPPAYGPYRWVRYYGDALLVNIYTGQVVDVVHDFFW